MAGLRLAVSALRRSDDHDRFLVEFSGDDRSVADYLTGEMLSGLDPETLEFARAVSVCSLLFTELAAELSGRPDAGLLLDRLGHSTALVARTGPGGHRIHALLRSYLLAHLQRRSPSRYRQLEGRAARWWAGHKEPAHALRHAERSGDEALLGEVLQQSAVGMLLRGELEALRHRLTAVGTTARRANPTLALPAAITHLERAHATPQRPSSSTRADVAQCTEPRVGGPAHQHGAAGGRPGPRRHRERAACGGGDRRRRSRGPAARQPGCRAAGPSRGQGGRTGRARAAVDLARALDLAFLEVHALTLLASLTIAEGDGRAMARFAQEALTAAGATGHQLSARSAAPSSFLAYADLLGGDPDAAADRTAAALRVQQAAARGRLHLHAVHGAARADRGEGVAGLGEIARRPDAVRRRGAAAEFCAALAVLEQRAAVMLGNPGAAAAVVVWLEQRIGHVARSCSCGRGQRPPQAATRLPRRSSLH